MNLKLVSVLKTGELGLLLVAKSLLDDAGIEYYAKGEELQDLFGAGRLGTGFNILTGPVEILVREEDAPDAAELLKDLHPDA